MSNASIGISPVITIDRGTPTPLQEQIYDAYRAAILRGDLGAGQQIPSSRELASEIKVSRFPVVQAYAQLIAEGYFEGRIGAGTFISSSLPEHLNFFEHHVGPSARVFSGPRRLADRASRTPAANMGTSTGGWGAFGIHQPAFDHFPFKTWSDLVARHSLNPRAASLHQTDPLGSLRFREAISSYLHTSRGVKCDASQVMIVSGSQQALDITVRVLLDPEDSVWIEEPGYRLLRALLISSGCRLIPVPVDDEGMDISAGILRGNAARVAFVSPSHQYPLGSTMSISRRLQLVAWAQSSGAWIVEDDYDSEYRYGSRPIPALQGLDVNGRVIYIGTFSNVMFPSMRIGYLVIPADLVERFVAIRSFMDIFPPYLHQEVLTDFIHLGHFGRHLRKMRMLYCARRATLVDCLYAEFGEKIEVHGSEAGMYLTVTLPEGIRDTEVVERAAKIGLWMGALSPSYLGKHVRHGLVLGFGSTAPEQIPRAVRGLRSVLAEW
jgi:GntR family transcriptional regulator / MocR family aminotransferase